MSLHSWMFLIASGVSAALVIGLFLSLFSEKRKKGVILIPRAFFLTFFLITIFYPYGGSLQDGSLEVYPAWSRLLPTYVVYFLLFVAVFWVKQKYYSALQRVYILSMLMAVAIVSYGVYDITKRSEAFMPSDSHADLSFAKNKNIVVILADMLQGSSVEQALNLEPEIKDAFSGFTFYTRAVSPFPFTNYSLPALLMGKTYAKDTKEPVNFADNLALAQRDSFITDARKQGYESVVVGALLPASDETFSLKPPDRQVEFSFVCGFVDLGMVRIFKRHILGGRLIDASLINYVSSLKSTSYQFMEKLTGTDVGSAANKIFFIHNFMVHSPVETSKKRIQADFEAPSSDVEYLEETLCFLSSLDQFCEHLKRLGVYDNALIIVVGDHGHFSGYSKSLYTSFPGAEDFKGYESGPWARAACMYNPALLIKPPKAEGKTLVSREKVSITHVRLLVDAALKQRLISPRDVIVEHLQHNPAMDVIVFSTRTETSPYTSSKSHVAIQLHGNASELARLFLRADRFTFTYHPYSLGTEVKITKGNNLLEGAWISEEKGAWLTKTAYISLSLKNPPSTCDFVLTLNALPLTSDSHPCQRVRVRANGQELGVMTFRQQEEQSLTIPGSIVRKHSNKLLLELEPIDAVSPKELGKWNTEMRISIFLQTVAIKKLDTLGKSAAVASGVQ